MSLESYYDLTKAYAAERNRAAYELVLSLRKASASGSNSEIDYALKRLVRGLSSSTEAARQGFASCLSEALIALPQIELSVIRDLMMESTEVTGSLKGHEERDLLLGRLFTCLAVARSGRLQKKANEKEWEIGQDFFSTAIVIFSRKKVLRSLAAQAVVSLLQCMPPKIFCKDDMISQIGKALGCRGSSASEGEEGDEDKKEDLTLDQLNPDQLLVALVVQSYLRQHGLLKDDRFQGKLPKKLISKTILKSKRIPKLIEPLKASSASFPQMHPVWDYILEELLSNPAENQSTLQALWMIIIDGHLANATHERKALAMLLLQKACKMVPTAQLPICLSSQVLKTLLSSLSTAGTANKILAKLAKQTLDTLLALGSEAPEKKLMVGSALITRCDVNFDQKTGTKTIQGLLDGLSCQDLSKFVGQLAQGYDEEEHVCNGGDDEEVVASTNGAAAVSSKKLWTVDALYALSRSPALSDTKSSAAATEVTSQILRLLLSLAYFDTESFQASGDDANKKKSKKSSKKADKSAGQGATSSWIVVKTEVTPEVRKVATARFHSLLADLGKKSNLHFTTPEGSVSSLGWLWIAHEAWRGLEAHGAKLVAPLGEEAREAREKMLTLVEQLKENAKGGADDKLSGAFAGLMMQIGLYQLETGNEQDEDGDDILGDLCRCYEDLVVKKKAKKDGKKKGSKKEEDMEEDVDPMAVLADVCVGALSSSQHGVAVRGLRDIIKKAWALVCSSCPLTRPALDVLLGVVCKISSEEDGNDDSEDDDDDDDSEDDMDEDALATLDRALKSAGVKADSADDDDDDAAEAMEQDSEDDHDSSEDEEEEEEIMLNHGSGELMRILGETEDNDQFNAMISMRKQHRQGDKASRLESERVALQHRLRTLDLLEVVLTKQHASPLLLVIIPPCMRAIRLLNGQAGPGKPSEIVALAKRMSDIINKKLAKARPKLTNDGSRVLSQEELKSIIEKLMADMRKASTSAQTSLLVTCLTVCTRAILGGAAGGSPPKWLTDLYCGLLGDFMTKRSSLTAAPFEQLVTRFPSPACIALLPQLISSGVAASKDFRQAEAFRLIGLLYGQRKIMAPEALAVLEAQSPLLMKGLEAVLNDKGGEMNSKRLKPVLECCQAVATYMNDGSDKKGGSKKAAVSLGEVLLKVKDKTASDPLKKMCANVAKLLGVEREHEDEEEEETTNKGKGGGGGKGKKDKGKKREREEEKEGEGKSQANETASAKPKSGSKKPKKKKVEKQPQ